MTVSMAGHFFLSTTCWWRADRSDSPPGGKACQYRRFLSGQETVCASTGGADRARAARQVAIRMLMNFVSFGYRTSHNRVPPPQREEFAPRARPTGFEIGVGVRQV